VINRIRNSILTKTFWGLMGLYLFNISVDTADPNPEHIPEDLSFNDQESIVEIILEQVLGFEDSIKEYDDHDTEDYQKKKSAKIDVLVQLHIDNKNLLQGTGQKRVPFPYLKAQLISRFKEVDSPPPKA